MTRFDEDVFVAGTLAAQNMVLAANAVRNDANVAPGAGIQASKLQHRHQITLPIFPHETDVASTRRVLYVVYAATATILKFAVGVTVAAGATTTVTIDLYKNGSSILLATFDLDNGDAAYDLVEPSGFSSADLAAGDVLEVVVTLSGANEPKGLFAHLVLNEDAQ